ncbi:type I-E CRISPR-associated protein Cse2/CasB [Stutzerimonas stutzeri]|uniref:Type I-E CRISPR-associated protein Cse2/CasB n=1 Tax=Stutzerimonas stutzeri TaxID=316 RepID=A0A2N8RDJ9_STUST|nr:type I-E CRISPR-associated protein Cse2/CasB [Stutzerimonas stutzeri]EHY79333.1 CRISPR-associated Cse2 family protein [Stutzerimonas stutzeri ATCC 14405 = CCUG 16156]MCQ4254494.1 type I-E CRISPR-associated protein Cse2/CasB [Stutzerimonas stutzeri]PNF59141.1 type I-E CRISPR-associated protein Cse2/CasB [Stutzerimonas stutzeri]QOZ94458.1 type I-E CRISPR-associated protein Cse2/CasB [Stutzerimonas stutzeri]
MSEHAETFIAHLIALKERDRGALAALRHSLAFEPGCYPRAFPYVERFAGEATHERDARRLALYAVAGLFARHPHQQAQSFATALGELMARRQSPSIEGRFIALLGANAENIVEYLRQGVSLLAADDIGCDYALLLDDLSHWLNPNADPSRLRQRWARDFYRAAQTNHESTDTE